MARSNSIQRIDNLHVILGIMFLAATLFGCKQKEDGLPNIIIVFTDDQGYADLGCYGATDLETPNIDRLASEGVRFTDFYASQAVCSSSRASLLTGCYSERVGIIGALSPFSKVGLNKNEITIAEILKEKGYNTAIFGKWHLGDDTTFSPLNNGFDEYYGLPYSNDMWPVNYDGVPMEKGRKSNYPELYLMNGKYKDKPVSTLQDQGSLTQIYTKKAIDFIRRNSDNQFFLYLPHSMPHVPLGVSSEFDGVSSQGMYGDVISEIDWSVGEIMEALKEEDIINNTIVIYTSDNGPWLNYGNHAGSAKPLREGKGTAWEGGCRVPAIISWPGMVTPGREINSMASTIDLLPTIAEIVGAQLPDHKIDGISIKNLLIEDLNNGPRDHFYYYYERQLCGVRKGNWKLVFPHKYRSYLGVEPGNDGYPGPYNKGEAGLELYNLKYDIGEKYDSAEFYPSIVKQLEALGDSARHDLGDNLTKTRGKGVRKPGRLAPSEFDTVSHKAIAKKISTTPEPNYLYQGQGSITLVNGIRGSYDFKDEQWLGYWGEDFEIVLDMGEKTFVKEIQIGFLQSQGSWIFYPGKIEILISSDSTDFILLDSYYIPLERDGATAVLSYKLDCGTDIRKIKFNVKNPGPCPDWHPGEGGDTWVFVDEIIIN